MVLTRRGAAAAGADADDGKAALSETTAVTNAPIDSAPETDQPSAPEAPKPKKKSDFMARLLSGVLLTGTFVLVVRAGQLLVGISVILMEIGMFNEILRLGLPVARENRIPWWRTIGWYFFFALQFLLYGKLVLSHFYARELDFTLHPAYQYAMRHHTFLSFCMYCAGFVGFVISLRQNQYHFQFTYFGRALVALLLVVVQSHFMILNIAHGLIWFILPCWLIIVNDSFGYFCGRLFGKHSLTVLSPKKTWEGYIGAGIFTMIAAYFLSGALSAYPSLICPKYDFDDCKILCPPATCDPIPDVFMFRTAELVLPGIQKTLSLSYRPAQLHATALGLFAAVIAPFGGFFASGAKRAFNVKDFGSVLPGHGGVTDRVDCQLMMAVFTNVYLINFVRVNFDGSPDVGKLMAFVADLSTDEQIELLTEIYNRLNRKGISNILANISNATVPSG
ncbi:Phosphatidate cytidylyltransferase [Gracilaria domingensis]|nr:Phosphatidate cytidylyltransferase [Gracilaria domingensis]